MDTNNQPNQSTNKFAGLNQDEWNTIVGLAEETTIAGHVVPIDVFEKAQEIGEAYGKGKAIVVRQVSESFIEIKVRGKATRGGLACFQPITRAALQDHCSFRRKALSGRVSVEPQDFRAVDHGTNREGELQCIHTAEANTIAMPDPNTSMVFTARHFASSSGKSVFNLILIFYLQNTNFFLFQNRHLVQPTGIAMQSNMVLRLKRSVRGEGNRIQIRHVAPQQQWCDCQGDDHARPIAALGGRDP